MVTSLPHPQIIILSLDRNIPPNSIARKTVNGDIEVHSSIKTSRKKTCTFGFLDREWFLRA